MVGIVNIYFKFRKENVNNFFFFNFLPLFTIDSLTFLHTKYPGVFHFVVRVHKFFHSTVELIDFSCNSYNSNGFNQHCEVISFEVFLLL